MPTPAAELKASDKQLLVEVHIPRLHCTTGGLLLDESATPSQPLRRVESARPLCTCAAMELQQWWDVTRAVAQAGILSISGAGVGVWWRAERSEPGAARVAGPCTARAATWMV